MTESFAAVLLGVFVASLAGTGAVRRYALARGVMDTPTSRSSHRVPTPRGGGVAIFLSFAAGLVVLSLMHQVDTGLTLALLGAAAIVAAVGFIDDHTSLSARWRLVAHFAAAVVVLWRLGVATLSFIWLPRASAAIVAAIALVWLINLYNFMDGIDGIAGTEAVTVALCGSVVQAVVPSGRADVALPLLLAAATLGFLVWNVPPARIFMGDAGSGLLGLLFGTFALLAGAATPRLVSAWVILLGVFLVDATVTLLRRLLQGERVYEAHRSHAYQHAALRWGKHLPVVVGVGLLNVLWLFPWALAVDLQWIPPAGGLGIAYLPLVWLAFKFEAGRPTE